MKIDVIPIPRTDASGRPVPDTIVKVSIRGAIDASDEIVKGARELLRRHASPELVASFDRAIAENLVSRPE